MSETAAPEPVRADAVEDRLDAMVGDVDDWLDDVAEEFDPLRGPTTQERRIRSKGFTEAAMYCYVAEMGGADGLSELRDLLVRRANDERYYAQLRRKPDELTKLGYPIVYLSAIGELDDEPRRTFEEVLAWPETWTTGQQSSRLLDLWHLCRMYGYDDHDLDHEQVLAHGYTSRYLNPARIGQLEAFGLTHEFLFYHNLGVASEAFADEPLAYEYPSLFPASILRFMAEDHVDLVSELLLCGVLQRQVSPGFVRFTLGWILDNVEGGTLTFPTDDAEELMRFVGRDLPNWEGNARTWRCYYHPTIVAGKLGRALGDAWPDLNQEVPSREFDYQRDGDHLLTLGEVFASFADYSLERGATLLRDLGGTPVVDAFDDVVEHAVRFLETQRQPDGTYGAWLDERMMYANAGEHNTDERFDEELLAPLSDLCDDAVETASNGG